MPGFEMQVVFCRAKEIGAEVEARAQVLAAETREAIAEDARENAPVDTGELEESVHVDGESVVVASDHANFVENGTVHMAAEPFFGPAIDRGQRKLEAGMRKLI